MDMQCGANGHCVIDPAMGNIATCCCSAGFDGEFCEITGTAIYIFLGYEVIIFASNTDYFHTVTDLKILVL